MTRPYPFDELFNLPIGGEMLIRPKMGETADAALKRLKLRASKYRTEGRSFRMKIDDEAVRAQRTEFGMNTKMADWLMMRAGDRLLLKSKPTNADIKKATNASNYLNSTRHDRDWDRGQKDRPMGFWRTLLDENGWLIVECMVDLNGANVWDHPMQKEPLRHLWEGEWA